MFSGCLKEHVALGCGEGGGGAIQQASAESQGCMAIHPKPAREIESDSDKPYYLVPQLVRYCGAGSNGLLSYPGRLAARKCCKMGFARHLEEWPGPLLHTAWRTPKTNLWPFLGCAVRDDASVTPTPAYCSPLDLKGDLLKMAVMSVTISNHQRRGTDLA